MQPLALLECAPTLIQQQWLLQPLALLEGEPTPIQESGLLLIGAVGAPLVFRRVPAYSTSAVVASYPSVGDPRPWVHQRWWLRSSSTELWQPLALLEWQPTLSHDSVAAPRYRSTPRSSGSPRLSDDATRRAPGFHTSNACRAA